MTPALTSTFVAVVFYGCLAVVIILSIVRLLNHLR
jgi:hypothetical protein